MAAQQTENRYHFAEWHEDFPTELELPTPSRAPVYERTRRQAIERVVANLKGDTRREVWLMALEFFDRAPEEAAPLLVEAMDRMLGNPQLQDVVTNTIDAMGRTRNRELEGPLRRALEHPNESVRQAAFIALTMVGSPETLKAIFPLFRGELGGRSRSAWLVAARERLGADVVPLLRPLMVTSTAPPVLELMLKEVAKMPAAIAAQLVDGLWEDASGSNKAMIAAILHAAGNAAGTVWLRNALRDVNPGLVAVALQSLQKRELGALADDVLRCQTHERPEIHLELARTLAGRPGDEITKVFQLLAGTTELVETKCIALRELQQRGDTDAVTILLGDVETATGTRLELILRLLAASGDPRAVPVLLRRFESTPGAEGRAFLQALSTSQAPGAAKALIEVFLGEPKVVNKSDAEGGQITTTSYVPTLLLNLRGEEPVVIAAWKQLPKTDYVRRSLLLGTLWGIACDREDAGLRRELGTLVRDVLFDVEELPQLRIQALNAIGRRAIDLDDVGRLRRLQETTGKGESPAMRALIKDYLTEFF